MKKHSHFGPKCGPCGANLSPAVAGLNFRAGEVYLFHRSDSRCPGSSSLWVSMTSIIEAAYILNRAVIICVLSATGIFYRKSIAIADVPAGMNYATIYRD